MANRGWALQRIRNECEKRVQTATVPPPVFPTDTGIAPSRLKRFENSFARRPELTDDLLRLQTTAVRGDALRTTASTCSPSVTNIRPSRGPAAGGTLLTVYGRCLDAGAGARVLIGELNSTCTTVTRDRAHVTCTTGPADGDAAAGGHVRVVFDDGRTAAYAARPFAYVAVDANQTFGGIVSGGTVFWVRGRFPRNGTARVTVGDAARRHYDGECVVRNGTHMSCRSPCTRGADRLRATLPLAFRDEFAFAPPPGWDEYRPYPDPSVADFTADDDGRVTVSGRDLLDVGYSRADDLSVSARLSDVAGTSVACDVSDVHADRIVCRLPPSPQHRRPLAVTVRVGHTFAVNVSHRAPARFSHSPRTVSYLPGIAVTAVYVLFVPVLCAALFSLRMLRGSGTTHTYDLLTLERRPLHTTMRPLNDDAAADDDRPSPTTPPENARSSLH